jgi:2'-5' RNA ligase
MRAFIAVEISDEVKERIEKIKNEIEGEGIRPVEKENMHITLHFLGEIDERKKNEVIEAMDKINVKKFELNCQGAGVFPSMNYMRVIWVGVEAGELRELHKQLGDELKKIGFRVEEYSPHLTIARVKFIKDKEKLASFIKNYNELEFGKCLIDRVILKNSTLTLNGPIYENVHEVKLS